MEAQMETNFGFKSVIQNETGLSYYVGECYVKLNVVPEVLVKEKLMKSSTIPFPALTICPWLNVKKEFFDVSEFVEKTNSNVLYTKNELDIIPSGKACAIYGLLPRYNALMFISTR